MRVFFILMRILLNALVELISAAVDLEKDLFYLGSWSKGIQQSPQIRSDWQVTQDVISTALFGAVILWSGPSFIHDFDAFFDATRYMTLCLVFCYSICLYLCIDSTKAAHNRTILCNAHSPPSCAPAGGQFLFCFIAFLSVNKIFYSVKRPAH